MSFLRSSEFHDWRVNFSYIDRWAWEIGFSEGFVEGGMRLFYCCIILTLSIWTWAAHETRRVHAGEFFCGARTRCRLWLWRTSSPRGLANLSITRRTNLAGARPFRCFPPCALPWVFYYLLARLAACAFLPRLRSPEQYAPDKATCIYIKTQFGLIIGARVSLYPEYNHEPDEKITKGIPRASETDAPRQILRVNICTKMKAIWPLLYINTCWNFGMDEVKFENTQTGEQVPLDSKSI